MYNYTNEELNALLSDMGFIGDIPTDNSENDGKIEECTLIYDDEFVAVEVDWWIKVI